MNKSNVIPFPNGQKNLAILTDEELGKVYEESLRMKEWCFEVEQEVIGRLSNGNNIPKFIMTVLRKGAKRWVLGSTEKRKNILQDYFYVQKPASPTEIEKLVSNGTLSSEQSETIKSLITVSTDTVGIVPIKEENTTNSNLAEEYIF